MIMVRQGDDLDPVAAILEYLNSNNPSKAGPAFVWIDARGAQRAITKGAFLKRMQGIWLQAGGGPLFGHSFRIGGASFFLAAGVSPETVRLLGRWKSIAFDTYIRAFILIAPQHLRMRSEVQLARVGF